MKIIKAGINDKDLVLPLLDQFRTEVNKVNGLDKVSSTAIELGAKIYQDVVNNSNSAIFLALDDDGKGVGVITVNKNPVLRKGEFKAEIEELFIRPDCQGKGTGTALVSAVEKWSKENNISYIELISGNELVCAHKFYNKLGFIEYGKGFKKVITD